MGSFLETYSLKKYIYIYIYLLNGTTGIVLKKNLMSIEQIYRMDQNTDTLRLDINTPPPFLFEEFF